MLQRPLIVGLTQESPAAVAEIAPALIDVITRIIQLDSASGGTIAREQLNRLYGIRGLGHLALGDIEQFEADARRAGREWVSESGFHGIRFVWAYHAANWSGVVDGLAFEQELTGSLEGTILAGWEPRTVAQLSGELDEDEAAGERFAELLVGSGWVDAVQPSDRSWVYWDLFEARAKRGDVEGARAALADVTSLYSLARILTDNRYVGYRPAIEAEQGTDLAEGAARLTEALEARWDASNRDTDYLTDYIVALRMQARWQDIVDRFTPLFEDLERAIDAGETDHFLMNGSGFFVVNYLAHAEMMLGDVERGMATMETVVDLGLDAHPDLISQAINRMIWLLELGRHDEAVAVARALDETPEGVASDYAYALIYYGAACSALHLGEDDQFDYWREKLLAIEDVSPLAMLEYHLCIADEDAAAELIISELQGDEPTALWLHLQDMALWQAIGPNDLAMHELKARVIARPDVQAALANVGEIRSFALTTFYN